MVIGIPGMMMLQRFSPLGVRDPSFPPEARRDYKPLGKKALVVRAIMGGSIGFVFSAMAAVLLSAIRSFRSDPERSFDLINPFIDIIFPQTLTNATQLFGITFFSLVIGLATAATFAARRNIKQPLPVEPEQT